MWMLVKDHLRRNWVLLTLGPLLSSSVFLFFLLLHVDREPKGSVLVNGSSWFVFGAYFVLAFTIAESASSTLVRVWRTLPLRESQVANLAWIISVLAPPLLQCLVVLPTLFVCFWFGKADLQSLSAAFLLLLTATLLSGLTAFISTLVRFNRNRATPTRVPEGPSLRPTSHSGKLFLLTLIAALLMLYHVPWRWPHLGLSHLAGMCLAAGLTWKSYQMRVCLLEPASGGRGHNHGSSGTDEAPYRAASVLTWLAQDLKIKLRQALILLPLLFGGAYLGEVLSSGEQSHPFVGATALFSVVCGIFVFNELNHIAKLRVVRTLPLTANQCILLFLSYPFVMSLLVIPCAAITLWLAGLGHFLTFLLWGMFLSAGLCPFGLFLLARFGRGGATIFSALGFFGALFGTLAILAIFDIEPADVAKPGLWTAASFSAVIGLAGYFGLRHLIENSGAVYKRKLSDEEEQR